MRRQLLAISLLLVLIVCIWVIGEAKDPLYVQIIMGSKEVQYLEEHVVEPFEQEFDVDVVFEMVGWGDREEKLLAKTVAGVPPDIFMNGAEHILDLAEADLVEPLDSLLETWEEFRDFHPVTLGSSTYRGHHYGLPLYMEPRIWWYWRSLFEESGLNPDDPPTDWDGIQEAARKLTRREDDRVTVEGYDLSRFVYGSMFGTIQDFIVFLWQNGGELCDPNTYRATFHSEEGLEVIQYFLDLKHIVQPPGFVRDARGFVGRGSAIYLASGWIIPPIVRDYPDLIEDVGAVPALERRRKATVNFSNWLAIHRHSKRKDLAWELFKRIFDANVLVAINSGIGRASPRVSTAEEFVAENPLTQFLYDSLAYARPYPVYPKNLRLTEAFFQGYSAAILERQGAHAAPGEAARQWNLILAEE